MTTTDTPRTISPTDLQHGDVAAVKTDGWHLVNITTNNCGYWVGYATEVVLLHRHESVWPGPDAPLILIKAGSSGAPGQVDLPVLAIRDEYGDYVDATGQWWSDEGDATITEWEPMTAVPTVDLRDAIETLTLLDDTSGLPDILSKYLPGDETTRPDPVKTDPYYKVYLRPGTVVPNIVTDTSGKH